MQNKSVVAPASRDSRFELLRIVSLVLIVAHHYSVHGGFQFTDQAISFNRLLIQFIALGGKIGVDCFVLISGYFMVTSTFSIRKCLKIVAEILFYSVLCALVSVALGSRLSIRDWIGSFLPTITGLYWFATVYVALYICSPVLNIVIRALNQTQHLKMVLIALLLWCILPTFTSFAPAFSKLSWFFTLYMTAAYIRLYPNKITKSLKAGAGLWIVSSALLGGSVVVFDLIGLRYAVFSRKALFFAEQNMLPAFLCALSLFLIFSNLKPISARLVNRCAASMFGVYLLHDNRLLSPLIWEKLFRNSDFAESRFLFLHAMATILTVFLASLLIDQIRLAMLDKHMSRLVDSFVSLVNGIGRKVGARMEHAMKRISL